MSSHCAQICPMVFKFTNNCAFIPAFHMIMVSLVVTSMAAAAAVVVMVMVVLPAGATCDITTAAAPISTLPCFATLSNKCRAAFQTSLFCQADRMTKYLFV